MGKIAIVGVKGSGKTVLMTALGDRYQTADPFGLLLSPENADAFAFVRVNMAKMRGGEWPMETPHDAVRAMRWSLQREQADGPNKVFCDLDFLDFGGEIYTEAFGNGPSEKSGLWEKECATLKGHIGESQMLVVLVNLRDVVSGATDPDTLTALWVTKGMLDYASRDLKLANLAIAFTQVDAYRDVVEDCGGLAGVLKKYMPHVYNVYRTLPLFALSAVDKTVEGRDGLLRPAPDFGSQGLDELLVWMLGCTETGKEDADEIAAARARPHGLWQEIVSGMEALRADAVQLTGLSAAEERCAKIAALQAAAAELAGNALRHDVKDFSDEDLANRLAELDDWTKRADQTRAQWALVARKHRIVTSCAIAAILAFAVLVTAIAVMCHNASVDRLVAEQGYSYTSSLGVKTAVWLPGKKHPTSVLLKTAEDEGEWVPTRPGYEWMKGTADVRWCPGMIHPANTNLVSDAKPDSWKSTRPLYRWKRGTAEIEWDAGCVHPDNDKLVADIAPDTWKSTVQGYRWKPGTSELEWAVGCRHPDNTNLVADVTPDTWKCVRPFYRWKRGTTEIEWDEGCVHPENADLVADSEPETWKSTKPFYRWKRGTSDIEWNAGCPHPDNANLVADSEPEIWRCIKPFYRWRRGTTEIEWDEGRPHPGNANLVEGAAPETWKCIKPFYRWKRGTAEIEWDEGCPHPDNADLVADSEPETWKCTKPFYRWKRGTAEIEWDEGLVHPACADLVAAKEPRQWRCVRDGYKWDGASGIVKINPCAGDTREIVLPGGARMKMVWCPPCQQGFWMGSPTSEKEHDYDELRHRVKLMRGFWIGQYEVTQGQWKSVMGDNPAENKAGDDWPVENVSWDDCQKFIARVRKSGYALSLPTEAQWEYACRAGTETPFHFGSSLNGDKANCCGKRIPYGTSEEGPNLEHTARVGSYPWPNGWNIYDMHGNVSEWCEDRYDKKFYLGYAAKVDPYCSSGECRVVRGGSWHHFALCCRSANRDRDEPEKRSYRRGFRVVCAEGPLVE